MEEKIRRANNQLEELSRLTDRKRDLKLQLIEAKEDERQTLNLLEL